MSKITKVTTTLTVGPASEIVVGIVRQLPNMFPMMLLATKIWMNMAGGAPRRGTAQFGFLSPQFPVGGPIFTAPGAGVRHLGRPAWGARPGGSPPSATAQRVTGTT